MSTGSHRRTCNVMLRLTVDEHAAILDAKPEGEDLASFARRSLLSSLAGLDSPPPMREVASFIVAALSTEHSFDEALALFDDYIRPLEGGMTLARTD